jgi:glycosyltransferase involved in cell wall biosynthesis
LRSRLAAESFDVVVCHQAWPMAIFGPVVKSAGIPLVSWVHMAQTGSHWLDRFAARVEADCYICNSWFTASQLPPTRARVEVIYCPVESASAPTLAVTLADRLHAPVASASAPFSHIATADRPTAPIAPNGPIVIVQVSRMEALKGQRVLLEALARLQNEPAWECWQVGGAQRPAEAHYLESLRADADRLGVSDRVRFLGQHADVPRLLSSAHVFCQPDIAPEAFGISFVEAMHARLPVVTSAIGGALEVVDDTCGVLVPPNDPAALAATLERLLRNRDERESLGRGGPPRTKALCDPETQMIAMSCILDSVASQRVVAY